MAFNDPDNFGYVIIIAACTFILNSFQVSYANILTHANHFSQMFMIGQRRKKDNVLLPIMFSPEHETFNCYQRAHQNTLENVPFFLVTLVLSGIVYPGCASVLGGIWILSRLVYSAGYYTGNPAYRQA